MPGKAGRDGESATERAADKAGRRPPMQGALDMLLLIASVTSPRLLTSRTPPGAPLGPGQQSTAPSRQGGYNSLFPSLNSNTTWISASPSVLGCW